MTIHTGAAIVTGAAAAALVNVHITAFAGETCAPALADGPVRALLARGPVLARVGIAVAPVVATLPTQAHRALAVVGVA